MATIANTSDSAALNAALDQEFVKNFQGDATRLMEILGIFGVETVAAGTALKMLKVTGALNNSKTDASKSSDTGATAVTLGSAPAPPTSRATRWRSPSSAPNTRRWARSRRARTAR